MPYPYASGLFYPCTVQAAIDGLAKNRSIFGKKREGPSRLLLARRIDGVAKKTSATDFAAGRVGSPDVIHFDAIQWTCTFPAPDVGPSPTQELAHRFVWSHFTRDYFGNRAGHPDRRRAIVYRAAECQYY